MPDRRLLIGSQARFDGWESFDAVPGPGVDHLGDAKDLSRFGDATFAEVYASHVLEHFGYQQDLVTALREWRRVLVPRGVLYVSVPDLDTLAEMLLLRETFDTGDRWGVMRMMFGGQMDPHDFHFVGLNADFLTSYFKAAGFVEWARVDSFGLFTDTSEHTYKGWRISLNMLARNGG